MFDEVTNMTVVVQCYRNPLYDSIIMTGSYYTLISPTNEKLRIVGLNTNLYLKNNKATAGETDPAEQFQWLEEVLSEARAKSEKVSKMSYKVKFMARADYVNGGFTQL